MRFIRTRAACITLLMLLSLVGPGSPILGQSNKESRPPAQNIVIHDNTETTQSKLAEAEHLYRSSRLESAAEAFKEIIKSDEQCAQAYIGLVHVYLAQKKPADAILAAQKAAELAPNSDGSHVALGEVYFRQGRLAEAETEFARLVKANTKEARAYLGLSRIYSAASYHKHAKVAVDTAYSLDPADPDIRLAWIRTLDPAQRAKALEDYLSAQSSGDPEQLQELADHLHLIREAADRSVHRCRLVSGSEPAQINLSPLLRAPTQIRGFGVAVRIDEVSSKLFLDTGASGITINRKLAEKAGVKRISETHLKGVGDKGPAGGYVGYADSIKVGDLEYQDCYVRVVEGGSVADEEGIVGADLFSNFLVDLDFPRQKIRLSELPKRPGDSANTSQTDRPAETARFDRYVAPEMKDYTPVFRFGHLLLAQTHINNLPAKLFLIDTGASSNVISPAAAREVTGVSRDSYTTVKGVNGAVKNVFRADDLTFQFGRLRQKNQDVLALDMHSLSDDIGTEVSGILGFAMLSMLDIKIDYRDGLVSFIYQGK